MRRISIRILLAAVFAAALPAVASAQSIADNAALNAATAGGGTDRTFHEGDYVISADTPSISGDSGVAYILDGSSTLSVSRSTLMNGGLGGLYVDEFTVNDNAALTSVSVGSGDGMTAGYGMTQNGGTITAQGGSGSSARGINIESDMPDSGFGFVQNGGSLRTTAGTGNSAHGMLVDNSLVQNDGEIWATGNTSNSYGIWLFDGSLQQNGGSIIAQGGNQSAGHGMLVEGFANFDGNLTLKAGTHQEAYSMVVWDGITFGSNSLLTVDINGTDSGKIRLLEGNVQIVTGARLNVSGLNTVPAGGSRSYQFLSILDENDQISGQILGDFLTPNSQTLGFSADKSADGSSYSVTVTRVAAVSDVVAPSGNAGSVVSVLENAGSLPPALSNALDYLDNNSAAADFAEIVGGGLTPQQNVQALQGMRALSSNLSAGAVRSVNAFSTSLAAGASVANAAGYASLDPAAARGSGSTLWVTPFFSTGEQRGKTAGFADVDEKFHGASLGYTRTVDQNDFGVALNYIRGDYDSTDYRADSDVYGVTLVGRHRFIGAACFSPELSVWGGYGFVDQEQSRRVANLNRDRVESDPNVNQWYAGASLANHYQVTDIFHIKPSFGLNYTYQRQGSYSERGGTGLELDVGASGYNSLMGSLGVEFGFALGCRASMKISGAYEYEMGDKQATVRSAFAAAPALDFISKSQELSRHQGRLGAEVKYQITDRAALSAGYDVRIADHYVNHRLNVGFAFDF